MDNKEKNKYENRDIEIIEISEEDIIICSGNGSNPDPSKDEEM